MRGHITKHSVGAGMATITAALDERTWNAVNALGADIAAHIESGCVWVVDSSLETIALFCDNDFPGDLPLGTLIQCSVTFCNDSDVDVIIRTTMEIIDPDGVIRAESSPGFLTSAGWCQERRIPSSSAVTLDKSGIWVLHAELDEAVLY